MSDHPVISPKKLIEGALPLDERQDGCGPGEHLRRGAIILFAAPKKRNASRFSPRRRRASATNTGGVQGHKVVLSALVCQSPEFQNFAA
jgi:hypothetical protein